MVITTIRPDSELYRPWSAPNYAPFWTTHPTLEHVHDLLSETLFTTWMLNTMIISLAATAISLFCGLLAGYALSRLKFPFAGSIGFYLEERKIRDQGRAPRPAAEKVS